MPNKRVKTFLHVGCGPVRFDPVSRQADRIKRFPIKDWQELRLESVCARPWPAAMCTWRTVAALP